MNCASELDGITVLLHQAPAAREGLPFPRIELHLSCDASGLRLEREMEQDLRTLGLLRWRRAERLDASICSPRLRVRVVRGDALGEPLVSTEVTLSQLVRVRGDVSGLRAAAARGDAPDADGGKEALVAFHGEDGRVWLSRQTVCALLAAAALWPISASCAAAGARAPAADEAAPGADAPSRSDAPRGSPPPQQHGEASSRAPGQRAVLARIAQALERLHATDAQGARLSADLHALMLERKRTDDARSRLEERTTRLRALVAAVRASKAQLAASREALAAGVRALGERRAGLEAAMRSLRPAPGERGQPRGPPPEAPESPPPRGGVPPGSAATQPPAPSLAEAVQSIQLRRATMLLQLAQVFAVRVCSDGRSGKTYTINHLRPSPLAESAGSDDEENAAALGLVAQFAQAAARILLVTLRHPLELCTSRSHVVDRSAHAAHARLPLYAKGADPSAYRRAQQLLARDIDQLLDAVGIAEGSGGALLPSLEVLMSRVRRSPLSIQPW